jgi:hypothetical protein
VIIGVLCLKAYEWCCPTTSANVFLPSPPQPEAQVEMQQQHGDTDTDGQVDANVDFIHVRCPVESI